MALQETDADIVFLQEVVGENENHSKKIKTWTNFQYEFISDGKWNNYAYGKNATYSYRHHGNAILSKYPITAWEQIDVSLNRFEQRGILFCSIQLPAKLVHAYCIHLNLLHKDRKKQYQIILDEIKKRSNDDQPIIIAGDFNDWNRKASNFFEEHNFSEGHKKLYTQYAKTFPSFFPIFKLDRIYLKNISPIHSSVLNCTPWKFLSDHSPLFMEIKVE